MDLSIILALVSGLVIIVLFVFVFYKFGSGSKTVPEHEENEGETRRGGPVQRGARARMRAAQVRQHATQDARDDVEEDEDAQSKKLGAKKAAKLEAKAEKKAMREAEEREREEKKKRKEQAEEERKKQEEKEEEAERRREEEEKKAKEEEERREYEEYLKMKAAFSVEEEGYDETEIPEGSDLLNDFITYVKDMKVVSLEDVAAKFHMRTKSAIERIQELESQGRLTGVIDDRGKFIYISQEELEGIAKFVKQRGRVSIAELAENSNRLINLTPKISVES